MIYRFSLRAMLTIALFLGGVGSSGEEYPVSVLPPEHVKQADPVTGADLTFLTSHSALDRNLYFHQRSWLADSSMILFYSQREGGGLMAYITATGELVSFTTEKGPLGGASAAVLKPAFYALRGNDVLEITPHIELAAAPAAKPSTVRVSERLIATLPPSAGSTDLVENCDGTALAIGRRLTDSADHVILSIDVASGAVREICRVSDPPGYAAHVQWSWHDPNILSFAGWTERLQVVDARTGRIWAPYPQIENELVTHESWWLGPTIMFCGGTNPKPGEDSHVKLLNIETGVVRIIGAGAWWEGGSPSEIAKMNWWHAAGSMDGRWAVADNWHGDIMLFEGKTTRPHLLTANHRSYGDGDHPHVGWDRKGEQVVFCSHMLGDPNVCVATIPQAWQDALPK